MFGSSMLFFRYAIAIAEKLRKVVWRNKVEKMVLSKIRLIAKKCPKYEPSNNLIIVGMRFSFRSNFFSI